MKYELKREAVNLRREGKSYGEIGALLGVSKSTLSNWLAKEHLTFDQMDSLRSRSSAIRAESVRQTKAAKRQLRLDLVYKKVSEDIELGSPSLVSGFYLYWGEGTKTASYTVSLTNSDSALVLAFIQWLAQLGVSVNDLRAKLHLYSDQNENDLMRFWSDATGIPKENFNKSYIKSSKVTEKTYKGMFGNGTCVVAYHDRDVHEYVLQGIKYLRTKYSR